MTTARLTQETVEGVLTPTDADARVTQVVAEALTTTGADARVTQVVPEVVRSAAGATARLSQHVVEVVTPSPACYSSGSPHLPVYVFEVRKPPSVDPTEAAVLTPAAGAWHSDLFRVSSAHLPGSQGCMPYLGMPKGRRARIDLLNRKIDKGQLVFSLLDKKDGFDNAQRWVTAFVGNARGLPQLNGCRVIALESLDGGLSFRNFFTGRIQNVSLRGKQWVDITVRDFGEELEMEVFANKPHASVASYAFQGALAPPRTHFAYAWAANTEPPFKSTIQENGGFKHVDVGNDRLEFRALCMQAIAKHFDGFTDGFFFGLGRGQGTITGDKLRARIKRTDTQAEGEFIISLMNVIRTSDSAQNWTIDAIRISALPTTDLNYMAMPPNGTPVEWRVVASQERTSKDAPIYINDVHPVQLIADLVDGKFGPLKADGTVSRSVPRGASFGALLSDQSFLKLRDIVPEKVKLNKYVEDYVLKTSGLGWTWNALGQLELIDLRLKSDLPGGTPTVTDDDLVSTRRGEGWDQSRDDAITRIDATFYKDHNIPVDLGARSGEGFLDVVPSLVGSVEIPLIRLDVSGRALDLGEKIYKIDARTFRAWENDPDYGRAMIQVYLAALKELALAVKAPFSSGATRFALACRRGTAGDRMPGDLILYNISVLPNASTNKRGGTRIGRVLGREEEGNAIRIECIDMGLDVKATEPAVFTLTAVMPDAVDIAVTLNASGEPVVVDLNLTDATIGSAPPEADRGWRPAFGYEIVASGTYRVTGLQMERRVHGRARSLPMGNDFDRKQPSPWLTTGTSFASLIGTLNAPTGLTVSSITKFSAVVSWTLGAGSSDYPVEILLNEGGTPAWTIQHRYALLAAGTTRITLLGLAGPSILHTFGIRHVVPASGAQSAIATTTITTTTTATKAPMPNSLERITGV